MKIKNQKHYYRCETCKKRFKYLNNNNYETNLRKHLGNVHKIPNIMFASQQKNVNEKKPIDSAPIDEAILNAIIIDGRPFNDFNKPGIKKVLSIAFPDYKPKSRRTITRKIEKKYSEFREKFKTSINQIKYIALTTDLWKNRKRQHFLALTGHFFNENFDYISIIFSFRHFNGRHLSTSIKPFIIKELQKLEIENSKIVASTSDNGSNVKSALQKDFGIWCSCFCHNFNLILKPFFKQEKDESDSSISNYVDTSDDETDIDEDEEEEEADDSESSSSSSESCNWLDQ